MVGFYGFFGIFLRLGHATGRAKCAGPATPERVVCTELFLLSLTQPNDIGDGSQLFILGRASHRSMRRQATLSSRTGRVFLSLGYNPLQRCFFALYMADFLSIITISGPSPFRTLTEFFVLTTELKASRS